MVEKTEKHASVQMLEIQADYAGQRVDNFLLTMLKGVPKTRIYRIIRKGEVRVNKGRVKPEYKLKAGDLLRVPPVRVAQADSGPDVSNKQAQELESSILFENDEFMVVNKRSGLAVHGGSGISLGLIEALRKIRPNQRHLELVHRLDRDTSGCVMVTKKRSMLKHLHNALRDGHIDKTYKALVVGRWPNRKTRVNAPLLKNHLSSGERMVKVDAQGKSSLTEYRVCQRMAGYSLIEAKPITGRTHQIRVHCQYAGYPITGDPKYGDDEANRELRSAGLNRLFLHAESLTIPLPNRTKPLTVIAPLDSVLEQVVDNLKNA